MGRTVPGLGERVGNTHLEEFASYLVFRRDRSYRLESIAGLAAGVAAISGRAISPHAPVLGDRIFY